MLVRTKDKPLATTTTGLVFFELGRAADFDGPAG